jgi:hypothetical protein
VFALFFLDSHAYPGCLGRMPARPNDTAVWDVDVFFEDGAQSTGVCEAEDAQTFMVTVASYSTRAGTRVAEKRWRCAFDRGHLGSFRVVERAGRAGRAAPSPRRVR